MPPCEGRVGYALHIPPMKFSAKRVDKVGHCDTLYLCHIASYGNDSYELCGRVVGCRSSNGDRAKIPTLACLSL